MLDNFAPYAKAVVAFIGPALLIIAAPLLKGTAPTAADWLMALGTAIATGVAVYATPNAPKVEDGAEPAEDEDAYEPKRVEDIDEAAPEGE